MRNSSGKHSQLHNYKRGSVLYFCMCNHAICQLTRRVYTSLAIIVKQSIFIWKSQQLLINDLEHTSLMLGKKDVVKDKLHSFSTLLKYEDEWSASYRSTSSLEKTLRFPLDTRLSGSQSAWTWQVREKLLTCQELNSSHPVCSPSHFTKLPSCQYLSQM